MAWVTLNAADILSVLTQPESDTFRQGSAAPGVSDRLTSILAWVVDQVRGKVAACGENRNVMGPAGTIPGELYGDAIEIARYKLLTSYPQGRTILDEARVRGYTDALKHLDDAAMCELAIEPVNTFQFANDPTAFGSRDDDLCNPYIPIGRNRNVIDFGFWH